MAVCSLYEIPTFLNLFLRNADYFPVELNSFVLQMMGARTMANALEPTKRPLLPQVKRKNALAMLTYLSMLCLLDHFFVQPEAKLNVLRRFKFSAFAMVRERRRSFPEAQGLTG